MKDGKRKLANITILLTSMASNIVAGSTFDDQIADLFKKELKNETPESIKEMSKDLSPSDRIKLDLTISYLTQRKNNLVEMYGDDVEILLNEEVLNEVVQSGEFDITLSDDVENSAAKMLFVPEEQNRVMKTWGRQNIRSEVKKTWGRQDVRSILAKTWGRQDVRTLAMKTWGRQDVKNTIKKTWGRQNIRMNSVTLSSMVEAINEIIEK